MSFILYKWRSYNFYVVHHFFLALVDPFFSLVTPNPTQMKFIKTDIDPSVDFPLKDIYESIASLSFYHDSLRLSGVSLPEHPQKLLFYRKLFLRIPLLHEG